MADDPRSFLLSLFRVAVAAASADRTLPPCLPKPPLGRTVVVGAGKAAAAMAKTVEDHWSGDLCGLVITRYGHGVACSRIEVVEAGHPVPDARGRAAAERMLRAVGGRSDRDLVLGLISGGGSSLLALPAAGITLEDKQDVTRALLLSGAPIQAINCVRKHLSAIKGGRLASAAQPARVVGLIISDAPGDDPAVVASGPTVPDPTTRFEALAILQRYEIATPARVRAWLENPESETPKPFDPRLAGTENRIIACAKDALAAAACWAKARGFHALILGDAIEGEAREVATAHAQLALTHAAQGRPAILLSGGETTVTVRGKGRGGRNSEYALALALALKGAAGISAMACDTDGIDGTQDNAGALVLPDTLLRARHLGLDAQAALADNDAYGFFHALGDLVTTGPTRTNVNDFRAILVAPPGLRPPS